MTTYTIPIQTADDIDHGMARYEDCLDANIYRFEDVGFRTVEDRGPAWLGDQWCDLYLGDYNSCVQWGDQMRKAWKVKD